MCEIICRLLNMKYIIIALLKCIFLFVLICSILLCLYKISYSGSCYVQSRIDNKKYLVRDLPDKQKVADMLASIRIKLKRLAQYVSVNSPEEYKYYMSRLSTRLRNISISENLSDYMYTSYCVNKGDELVFCVRSRKNKRIIHDENLVMYVALHEISHIACPQHGHVPLFIELFKYIAQSAVDLGVYQRIDFKNNNKEYCGLEITESVI